MARAHAIHDGQAACNSCYVRDFKPVSCTGCGTLTRSYRGEQPSYCRSCRNKGKPCVRCSKLILGKAGFVTPTGPACASCAPYLKDQRPCSICGSLSHRLSRAPRVGINEPACKPCIEQKTHATCPSCGKYRPPFAANRKGVIVCKKCHGDDGFVCSQCGNEGVRHSAIKCKDCYWKDHLNSVVTEHSRTYRNPWVRQAMVGYAATMAKESGAGRAIFQVRKDAPIFSKLDTLYQDPSKVSASDLATDFGRGAFWKNPNAFSYFFKEEVFPIASKLELEDFKLLSSQQKSLIKIGGKWYSKLVLDYHSELLRVRQYRSDKGATSSMSTISSHLLAARRFLEVASAEGITSETQITDEHIDLFLTLNPGYTTSVRRFVHWLNANARLFRKLKLQKTQRTSNLNHVLPVTSQSQLYNGWISASGTETKPALIGIFMLNYGQNGKQATKIRLDQLTLLEDGRYAIAFKRVPIPLQPEESDLVKRYLAERRRWSVIDSIDDNPWLFPGRGWREHLTSASITAYLRRWHVSATQLFATAMYQAYADGLGHPNVLVEAFGVTRFTAIKYYALFNPRLQNASKLRNVSGR